jgi:hypothetical protein
MLALLALLLLACLPPSSSSQVREPCGDCPASGTAPPLDALSFTIYNLREAAKQLLLLEDHLFLPTHRCPDCIMKHFLKAEALLEEGVALQGTAEEHAQCSAHIGHLRKLSELWVQHPRRAAEAVRVVRKDIVPQCFALTAK